MMDILFEDTHIIVCVKPVGVASQDDNGKWSFIDELNEHFSGKAEAYPVHRLDKAVGGLMVYAKSHQAASLLSKSIQDGEFQKIYLAVTNGVPTPAEGRMEDLLYKDLRQNKAFVVKRMRRGVKKAELEYKTLNVVDNTALVGVHLITGRFHQIRVQFASRKMPLVGDGKYGAKNNCPIMLFSNRITFKHPLTNNQMTFTAIPTGANWDKYLSE